MSWSNGNTGDPQDGPTPDDDAFQGTSGNDVADGEGGNDQLFGNAGNDSLAGGAGDDYLQGDSGNDTLVGGAGEDQMAGGADADSITDEGGGATFVSGGTGNDTIVVAVEGALVSFGTDLRGGDGDDSIVASGPGLDDGFAFYAPSLSGDAGNDTIIGTDIDDPFIGGDIIAGGSGNDSILAGAGNDRIDLGTGNDTLDAGDGDDVIIAQGIVSIHGGAGSDSLTIQLANAVGALGFTVDGAGVLTGSNGSRTEEVEHFDIRTGAGNDTIITGDGSDIAQGGAGADLLQGADGDDNLIGDGGNDTLVGGAGYDALSGGADDDSIVDSGGNGVFVDGGSGNDTIAVTVDGALDMSDADIRGGGGDDSIIVSGPGLFDGAGHYGAVISGDVGNDTITGTDANDPNRQADNIDGGDGNDSIIGGLGNDIINAGSGNDTFAWRIGDGDDIVDGGADTDVLSLEGWTNGPGNPWTVGNDGFYTTYTHGPSGAVLFTRNFGTVTCFAAGTGILTARGEAPVESLRAGDLVVVASDGPAIQALRWVGHMRIDVARARDRAAVAPILIKAGALRDGVPCRDLRVSPEHALLLDGRLVPARLLVDGQGVVQELWCRSVTYWHLELDAHGVLVADGAFAESYFDDGNRHLFDNAAVTALHPGFDRAPGSRYAQEACAPPILDATDPALAAIRGRMPALRRIA